MRHNRIVTYPGEVTTLEHEVGDDTVETRSLVSEPVLAGGKLTEVTGCLGDDVVVELEDDATRGLVVDRDIELCVAGKQSRSTTRSRAGKSADLGAGTRKRTYVGVGHGDEGGERKEREDGMEVEPTTGSSLYGWRRKLPITGHQHQNHPDVIISAP